MILRKELWHRGLRYRVNYKKIIGSPDIFFIKEKVAIFCDSEFWHGFNWEINKNLISSNKEYWIKKIEHNIKRDITVNKELRNEGCIVIRFWGKEIIDDVEGCADYIVETLNNKKTSVELRK